MSLEERNNVVRSLLVNLDSHSPGERNHAERVAVYAVATASEMGVEGDDLLTLRYAASLHDMGKVRVDAALLGKLGHLSDREIGMLRLHAELAMSILDEFDFLRPALPLIRHHHERWDGQGYPDGLIGEEIPLGSRLILIAEAFDTLTFPPAWAKQMTEHEAIAEIRSHVGTQFDPKAVDAFFRIQPLIQPVGL